MYNIFLYREERKVSKTAVISVCGNLYEVEGKLARKKIQTTFHQGDLTKIEVYYQGDKYPDAAPFELSYRTMAEYDAGTKLPVMMNKPVEGQISLLSLLIKKQDEELKKKENRISFTKLFEKEGVSNV